SCSCHDGEVLAVDRAEVELAAISAQCDRDRGWEIDGDSEVRGQQVRGPRGDDGECRAAPGGFVRATLHHAVATPHDQQLGAVVQGTANTLRCLLPLRHFVPTRLHAVLVQEPSQLVEPTTELLA